MPTLTKEQIQKALDKGITSEQIKSYMTSGNVETNNQPTLSGIANQVGQFGVGMAKGLGRSIFGLGELAATGIGKGLEETRVPALQEYGSKVLSNIKSPDESKLGSKITSTIQKGLNPSNPAQKYGGYAETALELATPMISGIAKSGPALLKNAESIYAKALKLSTNLSPIERNELLKTGLKEGLTISKAGVDKMVETMSGLEEKLGEAITKNGGKIIKTADLKPFVDEAKKFLGETVDVEGSKNAIKQIDSIYNNFAKKYGNTLTVETAQKLKTNTYQYLQKFYDKVAAPTIEASKQLARGLKEEIVKNAPEVGDINSRLKGLYSFEEILNKAASKAQNANIVSLGTKVLATSGNKIGGTLAVINELFGPVGKSYVAIGEKKLGDLLSKLSPEDVGILKTLIEAGKLGSTGLVGKSSNYLLGNTNK